MSVLVFLHGAGCTSQIFAAQTAAFPGSLALALPGHASPGAPASIDAFADAVSSELDVRELHDVVLGGFSMGGAIALTLALRGHPRVRALALLGSGARLRVPPVILEGLLSDFEGTARAIARNLFAEPSPEQLETTVAMMRLVGPEQCARDYHACNTFDVSDRLGEIDLPVVAITGERDSMTPPKYGQLLADRIPGAEARIIPGAGHLAVIENPGDTNEALRAFVTQY